MNDTGMGMKSSGNGMNMSTDHNPGMGGHGMGESGHSSGHQMSPYLFTRADDFFVLFKEANIQSTGAFIGALAASFAFALLTTIIYQIFRVHEAKALTSGSLTMKIAGGVMFAVRQFFHYVAMLIVMTMNVWLILAVVVGHGLGFIVFALAFADRFKKEEVDAAGTKSCDC